VIAVLKKDHREVREMFSKYRGLGKSAHKSRQRIADQLVKELSRHAAAEEQVLYPNLRKTPGGERMADHAINEHQQLKETLAELSRTKPDSDQFDPLVKRVKSLVDEHVREEEREVFAHLRRESSKDELQKMGKLTRSAKRMAPTRPHPKAPNTPPGNLVAGAAAAVVDRARDAIKSVRS
jgi:hemerythrin superfamily protein